MDAYRKGGFNGIGYVLTDDDGLVGADLDHCRDPETGTIEPWALRIVEHLDSYTEITPSGTGLRIFIHGKLPSGGRKRGNVEMYDSGRYLTVTGWHLEGTPDDIKDRQAKIEAVHAEVFGPHTDSNKAAATPLEVGASTNDQELIAKAMGAANGGKFASLWRGDVSGYPSRSEADLALASLLAFWTGGDEARMDRIYRQSELFREKWDERHGSQTYGEMTIAKALERTEFYRGTVAYYPEAPPGVNSNGTRLDSAPNIRP